MRRHRQSERPDPHERPPLPPPKLLTHLEALLDEVEEELWTTDCLPLHQLPWTMRGLGRGLSEPEVMAVSELAYAEVRRRHRLRLVWATWPLTDLDSAVEADPDTPLVFDIDSDGPAGTPMLVLVPADLGR